MSINNGSDIDLSGKLLWQTDTPKVTKEIQDLEKEVERLNNAIKPLETFFANLSKGVGTSGLVSAFQSIAEASTQTLTAEKEITKEQQKQKNMKKTSVTSKKSDKEYEQRKTAADKRWNDLIDNIPFSKLEKSFASITQRETEYIRLLTAENYVKTNLIKHQQKALTADGYNLIAATSAKKADSVISEKNAKAELALARAEKIKNDMNSRFTQDWRGGIASVLSGLSTRAKGKSGFPGMAARFGEQVLGNKRVMKSGTVSGIGVKVGGVVGGAAGLALSKLGKAIKDLSESALKAYGSIEKLKISLGVVFGSEVQANTAFQGIKEYAVNSPFGAEQTTEMAILLKQSGVYGYELLDTLKMIGDVSGGNEEKMKRIANNYAQIASIGKASMLDMRQFAYAGIPIYKAVAEELGVSQQVLRNMIADGKVTNDVMEKVFKNLTSESGMFYKATEKGAESLNARLTNLKDAATFTLASMGQNVMGWGDRHGEGGIVTGLITTAENILKHLENSVSTKNIEKSVKQIEKNDTEQARLKTLIEMSKDNPELKKYLENELEKVKGYISKDERLANENALYQMNRKRLEEALPMTKEDKNALSARLDTLRVRRDEVRLRGNPESEVIKVNGLYYYADPEKAKKERKELIDFYTAQIKLVKEKLKLVQDIEEHAKEIEENEAKYGLSASYVAAQNFTTTQMEMLSDSSDKATGLSVVAGNAVLAWEQNTEEGQKQKKAREDKEYAENYKRFTEYSKALTESGNLITGFKGSLSDFYKILQSGIIKPLETIDITQLADEGGKNENQKQSRKDQWEFIGKELAKVRSSFGSEFSVEENDKLSRMAFILSQENNQANVNAFATIFRGLTEELEKSGNKELAAAIGQLMVYVREKPEWMPETNPETSGKGKDAIPELWKRIVGSATGIDASFITGGAKSFFDTYRSTFENRNLAQGGISGMTAAGKSAAEISTMLRYSGRKSKDGTLQIDWEATAEVMKDFMLSGRASVKELEEYSQAIEGQISVYDKLKETMFTTGEDWANIDPKVLEEQLVNAFSGVGASLIAVNEAGQQREVEAREGQLYFKGTKDLVYAQNEYKMSMEKSIEAIDEASKSLKELSLRANNAKIAEEFSSSLITERNKALFQTEQAEKLISDYMKENGDKKDLKEKTTAATDSSFAEKFLEQYQTDSQDQGRLEVINSLADTYEKSINSVMRYTEQKKISSPDDFIEAKKIINSSSHEEIKQKYGPLLEKGLTGLMYKSLIDGTENWIKYVDTLGYVYTGMDFGKEEKSTQETIQTAEQRTALAETFQSFSNYFAEFERMSQEIDKSSKDLKSTFKDRKASLKAENKEARQNAFAKGGILGWWKETKSQDNFVLKEVSEPLRLELLRISEEFNGISFEEALKELENEFEQERNTLSKWDLQGRAELDMIQGATTGDMGMYTQGAFTSAGLSLVQGTDVGDFAQGMAMGGPIVGLINMLVGAIGRVVGSMEILEYCLNPITNLLEGLKPLIKALLVPATVTTQLFEILGKTIGKVITWIFDLFGISEEDIDEYFDSLTGANDELERQTELLKTLNGQFEETLKLYKEAQEYYITEKRHLNAETAIQMQGMPSRKVNDMILTPHGNFSTAPDDYLLAMKDPTSLMGYGGQNVAVQTTVSVKVINQAGDTVKASASETVNEKGQKELVVMISKAVANDYASGRNGWDSAVNYRAQRANGRRY